MPQMLLFFDISGGELMVILFVAFLVFGPSKIPEVARKIGRGMNEIRRASDEIKREINKESRKLEHEVNGEGSIYRDIKKSTEEIRQDFEDAAKPSDEVRKEPPEENNHIGSRDSGDFR
ncbi:MAG TPA: twin-arginine translocase TatA/TatE family subunit [Bacteroidales bacterium]|nr:twin-arginine translocase TatA/TatE family subunit [Bacteroidales bacterium]